MVFSLFRLFSVLLAECRNNNVSFRRGSYNKYPGHSHLYLWKIAESVRSKVYCNVVLSVSIGYLLVLPVKPSSARPGASHVWNDCKLMNDIEHTLTFTPRLERKSFRQRLRFFVGQKLTCAVHMCIRKPASRPVGAH